MTTHDGIAQATDRLTDEIVALRRKIHEHPELAFEEQNTAARVEEHLKKLGIACRTGIGKTGIVAFLDGAKPGPTIAIRADMDALPITEPAGLPFASKVPGKMHACGHDAHTAIVLGVASILASLRGNLAGRAMFVFQPAEETLSGAAAMLEAGAFADPVPDAILGFHNWPQLRTGTVGWHPDAVMASSDAFDVTLKGVGGHGAHPHLAVDSIVGAAQFVTQLQTIVSREIAPIASAVVTIGRIAGGTARNIIAPSVELSASVRTLDADTAAKVEAAVRRILEGIKIGMRIDYELEWTKLTPVLRNDKATMARVLEVARETLGSANVVEMPSPSMGSEDFAWFAERVPSAHLRIGSKIDGHDTAIHRADYQLNEQMIPLAMKVMTRAVLGLMR
ncbi:MAG TPA: M20 family metallopeptidase [Casimicrobiaceae bacterium]|nr:M20 family metallopeptidase [Casimicrobiaceae bacterium]